MDHWKQLYENEKRQRLQSEAAMKEIINGLCLSAFTITEDSKMQLLKNDVQRLQQEIAQLESTKQQRLQHHLVSVNGMLQRLNSNNCVSPSSINIPQRSTLKTPQPTFVNSNNLSPIDAQNFRNTLNTNSKININGAIINSLPSVQQHDNVKFQKPKVPRKRKTACTEEIVRPNSALPSQQSSTPLMARSNSAVPPNVNKNNSLLSTDVAPLPVLTSPVKTNTAVTPTVNVLTNSETIESENEQNKSQAEDDLQITKTIEKASVFNVEKSKFFCEYCESTPADEIEAVAHIWNHVNEIKRMHAFECVLKDCEFKTNVVKDALTHKKSGHAPEENCKILDRRESLSEYFKHCVEKYFVHLDEPTKEKIVDSRHS